MRNALRTVFVWGFASFGLSMAMFLPASLQADNPSQNAAAVAMPTSISTDHFNLALKLPDLQDAPVNPLAAITVEPGPMPAMTLVATNKTGVALTIPIKVQMTATSLAPRGSRVPLIPKEVWHYEREITLNPGAAQSIDLTCDAKLSNGNVMTIAMSAADKTVYPARLAVKAPTAK